MKGSAEPSLPTFVEASKVKFAADLPVPKKLTRADLARLDREATEWREAVEKGTRSLERLTGADLAVVIR